MRRSAHGWLVLTGMVLAVATFAPWIGGWSAGRQVTYSGWALFRRFGAVWTFEQEGWLDSTGDCPTGIWTLTSGIGLVAVGAAGAVSSVPRSWIRVLTVAACGFGLWASSTPVVVLRLYEGAAIEWGLVLCTAAAWATVGLVARTLDQPAAALAIPVVTFLAAVTLYLVGLIVLGLLDGLR